MNLKSLMITAVTGAMVLAPMTVRAENAQTTSGAASDSSINAGGAGTAGQGSEQVKGIVDAETSKVLADLHRTNLAEIEMGNLAKDNAKADAVKQYGATLVKDHEAAQDKVKQLADQLGVALPDKDQATAGKEHATMNHLKQLKGAAFDKAFAQHMVEGHTQAITKLEAAQKKLSGPTAQLVTELLPKLREHQKTAQQLAKNPAAATSTHQ